MDQLLAEILAADGPAMETWITFHYVTWDGTNIEHLDDADWYVISPIVDRSLPPWEVAAALLALDDVPTMLKGRLRDRLSGAPGWLHQYFEYGRI